jgi:hypothetical protein
VFKVLISAEAVWPKWFLLGGFTLFVTATANIAEDLELSSARCTSSSFPDEILGADKSAVRVSRGYLLRGSATLSHPALNNQLIGPNR